MGEDNRTTIYGKSVPYHLLDLVKHRGLEVARSTARFLTGDGRFQIYDDSYGQSVFVFGLKRGPVMGITIEGLGTLNLIAHALEELFESGEYQTAGGKLTLEEAWARIGQATMAMIFNDMSTLGIHPRVAMVHHEVGGEDALSDARVNGIYLGIYRALEAARSALGGGETPMLRRILSPNAESLAGAAVGFATSRRHLLSPRNVRAGDAMIGICANGPYANGISMIWRDVVSNLPSGYLHRLSSGSLFIDAVLEPTPIIAPTLVALEEAGVKLRYGTNITGGGWEKIRRAGSVEDARVLDYVVTNVPPVPPVFMAIQEHARPGDPLSNREMLRTYNCGLQFVWFVARRDRQRAEEAIASTGLTPWRLGHVAIGRAEKSRVIVPSLGII